MKIIIFTTFVTLIISYLIFRRLSSGKIPNLCNKFIFLFLLAFALRILIAGSITGHTTDMRCFAAWSDRIFALGPGQFYSPNSFTDYPPGYMYILYLVGMIKALFHLTDFSFAHLVLLKLPAILCDMATGYLLYRVASKKFPENVAVLLSIFYLVNPAVLLNSSYWGQVDSVLALLIVAMCLNLVEGRLLYAYVIYGIGVLTKPQMIIFTPLLLLAILRNVILKDFSKEAPVNLFQGLSVILGMVLACVPFGLNNVFSQYINTLGSYPMCSTNAYNFWSLLGLNFKSQDTVFLFLPVKTWGTIAIVVIVIGTFLLAFKKWTSNTDYFLLGTFIITTMFTFSARMHERYLFPALALLLFAFLYKANTQIYLCYVLFTVLHFLNTAHVLFYYDPYNYDWENPIILTLSVLTVAVVILFYFLSIHSKPINLISERRYHTACTHKQSKSAHRKFTDSGSGKCSFAPQNSSSFSRLKLVDFMFIIGLMLLYSLFALRDLGECSAPQTIYTVEQGKDISLDFGSGKKPAKLLYFMGPTENREFEVYYREDTTEEWQAGEVIKPGTVFTWKEIPFTASAQHLRLKLISKEIQIIEFCFLDEVGKLLTPVNAADYPTLFDEQEMLPEMPSFRNGMYFDEIYHARTAYEYIHDLYSYENTHPPLGKILISLGIRLFGMNPFGWRIIGTLFGIAMVPIAYLFGKRLTDKTSFAVLSCVLFSFDFMHFSQTRIATIDVYVTFFVMLMYYFMFRYCKMSFYDTPLYKTFIPLGLCGICMGLGVASKWTGVYAGCGLAVLFFATLIKRYREYQYAKADPNGTTSDISHSTILNSFASKCRKTILFCVGFFGLIPALIYILSYIPFHYFTEEGLLKRMYLNQLTMFNYHSNLVSTHPYASPWYTWPILKRPVWYYSGKPGETLREGICAFGNPLVWWIGIPAFLFILYLVIKKKDKIAAFLTVGYLAQYLPWVFVTRITYMYHYFPSVIFVVLMIVYSLYRLSDRCTDKPSKKRFLFLLIAYAIATFALFLLFYPVLSGQPIEAGFVAKWLRWFNSWVLTAY